MVDESCLSFVFVQNSAHSPALLQTTLRVHYYMLNTHAPPKLFFMMSAAERSSGVDGSEESRGNYPYELPR